jgi:hypothetical protein
MRCRCASECYRSLGWFSEEQAVASQVLAGLELKPAEVFAVLDELEGGEA